MRGLLRGRWDKKADSSLNSKSTQERLVIRNLHNDDNAVEKSEDAISSDQPLTQNDADLKVKVLILDDDSIVLNVVGSIVKEAGGVPITAPNGVVAMDLVAKESGIGLVILDLHMPEMNGATFLQGVRRIGALPSVPVLILTGRPDADVMEKLKPLGVEGCILKPFNPPEFLEVISNYIQNAKEEAKSC